MGAGGARGEAIPNRGARHRRFLVFTHEGNSLVGLDLNSGAETVQVAGEFFNVDWMRALDGCLLVHSGREDGSLGAIRYRPATAATTEEQPLEARSGAHALGRPG